MWDPKQYQRFSNERSRPFFDLLSQIKLENPQMIVDLGCGDGNLTKTLLDHWPQSEVLGLDSSPEMIKEAKKHSIDEHLSFKLADLTQWGSDYLFDLIISNAVFQWIADHKILFTRLISFLKPKSIFAFQIPGNFDQSTHTILGELCIDDRWKTKLGQRQNHILSTIEYIEFFESLNFKVNAWETTYFHILSGENAVFEWVKGTALRPILAALTTEEQEIFSTEYKKLLNKAYPVKDYGTILPFKRIFVVAERN